jgi:hypothetical protein
MSPLLRIPLGIFFMFIGFLIVKKSEVMLSWFGRIPFAESKLGTGGSRTFYKLIGVGVVFIGVATSTNVITSMLESLAGFLTNSG